MSYSLRFCKRRASNPDCSSLYDKDWCKATEVSLDILKNNEQFKFLFESNKILYTLESRDYDKNFAVYVEWNPNGDFEYFTFESCISDGLLLYDYEIAAKCLYKIISAQTYNKTYGIPEPQSRLNYVVGNFVFLHEYGMFDKNKPWMQSRTTCLLPIKYWTETGIKVYT